MVSAPLDGVKPRPALVKCPKCETWTRREDDERWCPRHGVIPLE